MIHAEIPLDIIVEMFKRLPGTEVKVKVIVDTTVEILPLVQSIADYVEKQHGSVEVEARSQSLHKEPEEIRGR